MSELDYEIVFGNNKKIKVDPFFVEEDPDDEELETTSQDVVGILGFDPKEFSGEYNRK
jgi:hypothetical protein